MNSNRGSEAVHSCVNENGSHYPGHQAPEAASRFLRGGGQRSHTFLPLTYELLSTIKLPSMRPKHTTLTPQELEIMKLVWQRESATVRDIYEALRERRKIAYTTVMTMMKILETKGYLKKRRQDRAFLYRPTRPKNQVIGGMIREFIDRVFNGSAEPLLVHLVKARHIREKDLQGIVRMIEEIK